MEKYRHEIQEKDAEMEKYQQKMDEKDAELEKYEQEVMEKDAQLEKNHEELTEKNAQLEKVAEEMVEKATLLEKGERELSEKAALLEKERAQCQELRRKLEERADGDQLAEELQREVHRLEAEVEAWRVQAAGGVEREKELDNLRLQLSSARQDLHAKQQQLAEVEEKRAGEVELLQQQLRQQTQTWQHQQRLQQQAVEQSSVVADLQQQVQALQLQLTQREGESVATDDVKQLTEQFGQLKEQCGQLEEQCQQWREQCGQLKEQCGQLEEECQQWRDQCEQLEGEVKAARTRVQQTSAQLAEREEQLQQLQAEVQSLQQESYTRAPSTPESLSRPKTPDSADDPEMEERLDAVLSRAQHLHGSVTESLSSSLPLHRHTTTTTSSLSRWESEPGLSITNSSQEKEALIASLKRQLLESKELLAAAERSTRDGSAPGSLSVHTQQQMAHLRSELQRARSALKAMQEGHGGSEVTDGGDHLSSSQEEAAASTTEKEFSKRVEEVREQLAAEHRQHITQLQQAATRDLETKLAELHALHTQELQQLRLHNQRALRLALEQERQEVEKEHKTQLNQLCAQHHAQITRLRDQEMASLVDSSVTDGLNNEIAATHEMDRHLIGTLNLDDNASETSHSSGVMSDLCPPHIQALLDRLRTAGEHILSVSELELLQRHLSPPRDLPGDALLREAWEGEKHALLNTVTALKQLLSQADSAQAAVGEEGEDWRCSLVRALVQVYCAERLALEAQLDTLRLQQADREQAAALNSLDNRLHEQERLHQSGLDAMLRADRQSLLAELEAARSSLSEQRQQQQDLRSQLTQSLNRQEEEASNTAWKLQREVQVLEYKLQQEKVMGEDLRQGLESERRRAGQLSVEVSQEKEAVLALQGELHTLQLRLARTKDALDREQTRFTSVTDALEEEREKNSHLSERLEALRKQLSSSQSDASRSLAVLQEREHADTNFIKELQAELMTEREDHQRAVEDGEERGRQLQQLQGQLEREQQQTAALTQQLESLTLHSKQTLHMEAAHLNDLQSRLAVEQGTQQELQAAVQEKDKTLLQQASHIQQLQSRLQTLQHTLQTQQDRTASLHQLLETEREQLRHQQAALTQLRQQLRDAKSQAGEAGRHLELEKSRSQGLKLELERAQSEIGALTQHADATESQLQTQQSATWNKLRAAQRERDQLQVKVHEVEMELERLQDQLQDLELELDRSRQRELEARHDLERHKLYPPTPSPRSAPHTPRGVEADSQLQSRLTSFCQQLQGVGQRLHSLALKQRSHNSSQDHQQDQPRHTDSPEDPGRAAALEALMVELETLKNRISVTEPAPAGGGDHRRLTMTDDGRASKPSLGDGGDQKEEQEESWRLEALKSEVQELQSAVLTLRREKGELQRQLTLLQDQDNTRPALTVISTAINTSTSHPQGSMLQYLSDTTLSEEEGGQERAAWTNERLSLQLALDSAEHEIDRLKKELRSFRGRFTAQGYLVEADMDKTQRLYGKYLRAESFRKALVYQKKYLLLLLGGYQDSEQQTLAVIATMGGQPSSVLDLAQRRRHRRLYTMFRSAAHTIVAIFRMKYLVRKWKRAMRVGSPVVGGRVNQQYGYVATSSTFCPANDSDVPHTTSSTAAHVHTLSRASHANVANGGLPGPGPAHSLSSLAVADVGRRFYTPPTKETRHSQRSPAAPSSHARRQLMGEIDGSLESSRSSGEGGAAVASAAHHPTQDDFLQRLENLQSRLSSSHNGSVTPLPGLAWR